MPNVQVNAQDHQVGNKPGDDLSDGIFLVGVCPGSLTSKLPCSDHPLTTPLRWEGRLPSKGLNKTFVNGK
jgi:hypothetical protein